MPDRCGTPGEKPRADGQRGRIGDDVGRRKAPEVPGPRSLVEPWEPKTLPSTTRGIKTRTALIDAARVIFERDGFINSRVSDIAAEANSAAGTFYTYFDSKEEVLVAVLENLQDDMMNPGFPHVPESEATLRDVIEASNRAYLEAYERNARLMLLLEQVASLDPLFAEIRRKRARAFVARNAKRIAQLQDAGLADVGLDPTMTSWALSSMMSRLAYYAMVLGEPLDRELLIETVTTLWVNALRYPHQAAAQ